MKLFKSLTPKMREAIHRLTALGLSVRPVEYDGPPIPIVITESDCRKGVEGHSRKGVCTVAIACEAGRTAQGLPAAMPVYAASIGERISYILLVDGRLLKVSNAADMRKVITSTDTRGKIPEPGKVHFRALRSSEKVSAYKKRNKTLTGPRTSRGIQKHRPHRQRDLSPRSFYSKTMNNFLSNVVANLKEGKKVNLGLG